MERCRRAPQRVEQAGDEQKGDMLAANVELPLLLRGDLPLRRTARVQAMLQLVGLADAAEKFPWQLSGGMKMRVSIARALSVAPHILLLDEPFGALDEMTRDQLNEDLLKIRAQDPFTGFFVTHSLTEAVFLSTRIVVLSAKPGRIAETIRVPFSFPRAAELRETQEFLKLLAATSRALRAVRHGCPVHETFPSLDQSPRRRRDPRRALVCRAIVVSHSVQCSALAA